MRRNAVLKSKSVGMRDQVLTLSWNEFNGMRKKSNIVIEVKCGANVCNGVLGCVRKFSLFRFKVNSQVPYISLWGNLLKLSFAREFCTSQQVKWCGLKRACECKLRVHVETYWWPSQSRNESILICLSVEWQPFI